MSIEEVAAREIAQLMEDLRDKDATIEALELSLSNALKEIDRLKGKLAAWKENSNSWKEQSEERGKIITELADVLTVHSTTYPHSPIKELIRKSREEVQ